MPSFKRAARRFLTVAPGLLGLCAAQGGAVPATPAEAAQPGERAPVPQGRFQSRPEILTQLVAPTLTIRGEYRFGSKKTYNPNFRKSGSVIFSGDDAVEDKGFGTVSRVAAADARPRRGSAAGLARDDTVRGVSFVPDPALGGVPEPALVCVAQPAVGEVATRPIGDVPGAVASVRASIPRSLTEWTLPKPEDDFVTLGLASPSDTWPDAGPFLQLTYGSRGTQASHVHVVENGVVLKEPVGNYIPGVSLFEIVLNSQNQREYYIDGDLFYTSAKAVAVPINISVVYLRGIYDRIKEAHWLVNRSQAQRIRVRSNTYVRETFIAFQRSPDVQDLGSGTLARVGMGDVSGDGFAISDEAIGPGTVHRGATFVASPIMNNPLYKPRGDRALQAAQAAWTAPNPADVFATVGLICGKSYFTMQLTYGDPAHEGFVTIVEDGEVPQDSKSSTYVQGVSQLEISVNSQDQVEYYVDDELIYTSKRCVPLPCFFGVHNLRNLYDNIAGAQWLAVNVSSKEAEPCTETTTPCDDAGPSRLFEEHAAWTMDGGHVAAAGSSALLVMIAGLVAAVYRRTFVSIQVEDRGHYAASIEET